MDDLKKETEKKMERSIASLEEELNLLRSGRASVALFNKLRVDYYGTPTPLRQLASISIPEARLIVIRPFDRNSIGDIEKAILASELGLNPGNDGKVIRISVPPLNEERRKDLVKKVGALAENTKVSIRNIRRDANERIKSSNFTDDEQKKGTEAVQKLTDSFVEKIAAIAEEKKKEIMEI